MNTYLQVVTTTQNREDANKIARLLVEKRLAACVQLCGPIESIYWWKENLETTAEWICYIKTHRNLYDKVEEAIKTIHPYETPEIIALPIVSGSHEYLEWIGHETRMT
ncbi:MAG: divalent-cation tolerance protein CutA [Deltaproteobacteria bacterium]|jgi:periplasmic divalent cation tolerance protein